MVKIKQCDFNIQAILDLLSAFKHRQISLTLRYSRVFKLYAFLAIIYILLLLYLSLHYRESTCVQSLLNALNTVTVHNLIELE